MESHWSLKNTSQSFRFATNASSAVSQLTVEDQSSTFIPPWAFLSLVVRWPARHGQQPPPSNISYPSADKVNSPLTTNVEKSNVNDGFVDRECVRIIKVAHECIKTHKH